jgi:hypothetical protein
MKPNKVLRVVWLILVAALAMALVTVGFANAGVDDAGTTAANFLTLGAGPRILGMGGATLGLGNDLAAASWNPAALGFMNRGAFMLSHSGLDNESLQEWMGFGGRIGQKGTHWAVSGLYQGDGSMEGRDASNNSTGSFSVNSFAVGAHVAQQIGPSFTVGLGAKTVSEKLADVSGLGVTFDGGVLFRRGMIGAGIAAQNVGGKMKYGDAVYPLPTNVGLGVGVSHARTGLSVALDANFPSTYHSDVRMGAEWRWKEMMALRAGYRQETGATDDPLTGPTFGLGAGTSGFWLDYGYLLSGNSSGQHRVGITFFPGQWSGIGSDPFGQGDIPSDFESSKGKDKQAGPPTPPAPKKETK